MLAIEVEMRGWAQVPGSLKAHYFRGDGATSLCGRWQPTNLNPSEFIDQNHGCADNCAACKQQRQKHNGKAD